MALVMEDFLFVASGIDLFDLSSKCSESYPEYNVKTFEDFKSKEDQK